MFRNIMDTTLEEFDAVVNTNLRGAFYLTQLCLPYLEKTKGKIFFIHFLWKKVIFTAGYIYIVLLFNVLWNNKTYQIFMRLLNLICNHKFHSETKTRKIELTRAI